MAQGVVDSVPVLDSREPVEVGNDGVVKVLDRARGRSRHGDVNRDPALSVGGQPDVLVEGVDRVAAVGPCHGRSRLRGRCGQIVQRGPGQGAVDRSEEERSVVLVDDHDEAAIPRGSGMLLLEAEVRGIPVMTVSDHESRVAKSCIDVASVLVLVDDPEAVVLPRGIIEFVRGCCGHDLVLKIAEFLGPVVHQKNGSGVDAHLVHPLSEFVGLLRVDALMGVHAALAQRVSTGAEVDCAHESTDGEPVLGVLMEVHRRCEVEIDVALGLPVEEALGHVAVGSGERTGHRWVRDPLWCKSDTSEAAHP